MAVLTVQDVLISGITPTYAAAAAGGDTFPNDGRVMLHFKNTSGGNITVTVDDVGSNSPPSAVAFTPDVAVVVPLTNGDKMIGPFPPGRFNGASTNTVAVTYSGVTSLTVAAIRLPA